MVKFNNQAFDKLKVALGCKSYPMLLNRLEELGIPKVSLPTFYTWRDEGKIPMETLILLCNNTHFSLSYFFISDQEEDRRAYTVMPEKDWKRVFFFPEHFFTIIRRKAKLNENKSLRRFRKHIKEFNDGDFHAMAKLFVTDVVQICTELDLNLDDFLYDLNVSLPEENNALPTSAGSFREMRYYHKEQVMKLTEQMEAQNRIIRELKVKIRSIEDEKARLQKKCDELLEDFKAANGTIATLSHLQVRSLEEIKKMNDQIKELEDQLRNRNHYEKAQKK